MQLTIEENHAHQAIIMAKIKKVLVLMIVIFILIALLSCKQRPFGDPLYISKSQIEGKWQLDDESAITRILEFKKDGTGCATDIRPIDLCGSNDSFWTIFHNGVKRTEKPEYMELNLPREFKWECEIYEYEGRPAVSLSLYFTVELDALSKPSLVFRQNGSFGKINSCIVLNFYDDSLERDCYYPAYKLYRKIR